MIVKVQLSLPARGEMLIYNSKRDVFYQAPSNPEILKKMGKEYKKFFHANLAKKPDGTYDIVILSEAPHHSW